MSRRSTEILEQYRDKIFPWVKVSVPEEDEEPVIKLTGGNSPVMQYWLGDLIILYVADLGDRFQILLEDDLAGNMSIEELHQLATDNLSREVEFNLHGTSFGGHMLIAGGNHEAASICLPYIWEWLAEHLGDNLIVAIPAKDLVLVVTESNPDEIVNLKAFAEEIFRNGERLLTRNIFRYDQEKKEWSIVDAIEV